MISRERLAVAVAIAELAFICALGILHPLPFVSVVAVVLIVAVATAVSPLGTLLAIVVSLPYFYLPIEFGSQYLAASELLLVSAIPGFAARVVADVMTGRASIATFRTAAIGVLRSRLFLFLLVLTAVGLVTLLAGAEPGTRAAGLREWRWTLLLPLVFLSGLTFVARQQHDRMLLAFALLVAGVVASLHGLMDITTGGGVLADNVRRISGPFPHPNALALFLVRSFVLAVALCILIPGRRLPLLPIALITGVATLGTFSRGAMIAVVAGIAILAIQASPRVRFALGGAVVGAGAVALFLAGDRMRNALDGGSVSLRIDIWTSASRMIRDSPVLGYGPDQFFYTYSPRYILPTAWDERFASHAHNLIADSWIRLGVFGALAACIALVFVLNRVFKARTARTHLENVQFAALIALAAAMVHGLIDNAYFAHDLAMSVWLLAWASFGGPPLEGQEQYEP